MEDTFSTSAEIPAERVRVQPGRGSTRERPSRTLITSLFSPARREQRNIGKKLREISFEIKKEKEGHIVPLHKSTSGRCKSHGITFPFQSERGFARRSFRLHERAARAVPTSARSINIIASVNGSDTKYRSHTDGFWRPDERVERKGFTK